MKIYRSILLACAAGALLCSCDTYVTPGNEGNLGATSSIKVKAAFTGKPAITFPAHIALVRIEGAGSVDRAGVATYGVVTSREIETEEDFKTISKCPGIAGVVSMNNLLLSDAAATQEDVRAAAAKLHANAILIYTVNSESHNNDAIPPLTVVTLGLAPNTTYQISSSASAILMDTKTGFVYGALEQKATRNGLTTSWGSSDTIDAARRGNERATFEKLVASFDPFWKDVYARYNR
ncbi:MAG TPA: hypothetical protein VG733_08705 [Chthoniobacteraceae bacterium]|nr:hypothetical protein [Chthoniobacteraceae bacterium]